MKRGILYYVWGNYKKHLLDRSIKSLQAHNNYEYHIHFDTSKLAGLSKKSLMFQHSPFDITCFLDIDTIIKGRLNYGFEMAEKYGLACCIAPASSAYAANPNPIRSIMNPNLPQYNTGVIFYSKKCKNTFTRWEELCTKHQESSKNDQPCFSQAVYENINPYILPKTWNLRHTVAFESSIWHGNLKIIHSEHDI